jgi:predicted dehydrogenase
MAPNKILRVGLIGCGEITQVAHIPTLGFLSDYYQITYLCDVSDETLEHCKKKVIGGIPKTTRDAAKLCASPDVDIVCILNSNEYHAPHAILGLQNNKYVFVEKPMALSQRDADAIIEAEKKSNGKVFVGYMRRYAPAFLDAVKEIGGLDKITYARVRGMKTKVVS